MMSSKVQALDLRKKNNSFSTLSCRQGLPFTLPWPSDDLDLYSWPSDDLDLFKSHFLFCTGTSVLDFWWCLLWVLKPKWILPYSRLGGSPWIHGSSHWLDEQVLQRLWGRRERGGGMKGVSTHLLQHKINRPAAPPLQSFCIMVFSVSSLFCFLPSINEHTWVLRGHQTIPSRGPHRDGSCNQLGWELGKGIHPCPKSQRRTEIEGCDLVWGFSVGIWDRDGRVKLRRLTQTNLVTCLAEAREVASNQWMVHGVCNACTCLESSLVHKGEITEFWI